LPEVASTDPRVVAVDSVYANADSTGILIRAALLDTGIARILVGSFTPDFAEVIVRDDPSSVHFIPGKEWAPVSGDIDPESMVLFDARGRMILIKPRNKSMVLYPHQAPGPGSREQGLNPH
jgi:hypothetical protein